MRSPSFNLIVALEVEEGEGGVAVAGDDAPRGRLGCNSDTVWERARDRDVVRDVDRELRLASGEDGCGIIAAEEVEREGTVAVAGHDAATGSSRRDVDTVRERARDRDVVWDVHRELRLAGGESWGRIVALEAKLAEERRVLAACHDAARRRTGRDGDTVGERPRDGNGVRDVHGELRLARRKGGRCAITLEAV